MVLKFTPAETKLLDRTADALTAWLGKPVVGEIVAEPDAGFEWALFAAPLMPDADIEDRPHVQVGGPEARFLGSHGGLDLSGGPLLDCEFLWAVQLSDRDGARFVKVNPDGEETTWSDQLTDLLPFGLDDVPAPPDEDEDD